MCLDDLSGQLEQENVQHMEALVHQQLFAIKELEDLQAALEEELETATACQEVNVCN